MMINGAKAIFTCFKNILFQRSIESNKTRHNHPSPKEARIMVGSKNGNSNPNSIESTSDIKTNVALLTDWHGCGTIMDTLDPNNINDNSIAHTDSFDDSSLKTTRALLKDLMDDVKAQLLVEVKEVIDGNRKETTSLIEDGKKDTKVLIEENVKEIKSMFEYNKNETKRREGNAKDFYKKEKNHAHGRKK